MRKSVRLRAYRKGDEAKIVQLLNLGYTRSNEEYTTEQWEWKYSRTPSKLIAIAELNNEVVGHMALVPLKMKTGNGTAMGCQAVDLVVHPDARRRGVFLSLARFLVEHSEKEGMALWYGIPNTPAYGGHMKYGWFDVGDIRVRVRLLDTHRVVLRRHRRLKDLSPLVKVFAGLFDGSMSTFQRVGRMKSEKVVIEECGTFDGRMDTLWREVSARLEIAVVRDREYLNWRFADRNDKDYAIFLAQTDDFVLGYVVLATKQDEEIKIGYIVDILGNQYEVFKNLIQYSVDYLGASDVDEVVFWSPPALKSPGLLRRNGFLSSSERNVKLIARIGLPGLSQRKISQSRNWYFTMGDSDWA